MLREALAHVLKSQRGQKALSQEELGSRANLHRTYISQLERGLKSPTLDSLSLICGVLGIEVSELLHLVERERDARSGAERRRKLPVVRTIGDPPNLEEHPVRRRKSP